jgi:hypothetical protein
MNTKQLSNLGIDTAFNFCINLDSPAIPFAFSLDLDFLAKTTISQTEPIWKNSCLY